MTHVATAAVQMNRAPLTGLHAELQHTPNFLKPNYRILGIVERVLCNIVCHHSFGWPITERSTPRQTTYLQGYDSHQNCITCGTQRFYNSKTCTPGPLFVRTDIAAEYTRQQKPFDVYVSGDEFVGDVVR